MLMLYSQYCTEPVLSVHARSALTTVTSAPSYEDSHSLVLTVVSRHQYYVSVFKLEELRLRVGRAVVAHGRS